MDSPRAKRPKGEGLKLTAFRLSDELFDQVDQAAERAGVSKSAFMRDAVAEKVAAVSK